MRLNNTKNERVYVPYPISVTSAAGPVMSALPLPTKKSELFTNDARKRKTRGAVFSIVERRTTVRRRIHRRRQAVLR